jgi:hypothetical protein
MFGHTGDCHDTKGVKDRCVVGAINNYTDALKDSSSPCKQYIYHEFVSTDRAHIYLIIHI